MVHPPLGSLADRRLLRGLGRVDGLTRAHGSKDSADAMRFPTEKEARVAARFLTVCGMIHDARVERL
jgi:hypothetical protein